jgi:hypothetical protein
MRCRGEPKIAKKEKKARLVESECATKEFVAISRRKPDVEE